jgi:hypothetical protein
MASKAPFVVRWRDAVMDDPALSWRAKTSAMPLVRHANVITGHDCYPGAQLCADEMSVSIDTVERGWAELKKAGWLEILPLAAWRRKSQGAVKVFKFPAHVTRSQRVTEELRNPLTAPELPADSGSTFSGKPREDPSDPSERAAPHGKQERDDPGLPACSICGQTEEPIVRWASVADERGRYHDEPVCNGCAVYV